MWMCVTCVRVSKGHINNSGVPRTGRSGSSKCKAPATVAGTPRSA